MKTQYTILSELRLIDEKVSRLGAEISRLPEEIARIQGVLNEKSALLESSKSGLHETEKKLRDKELELKEKEDFLRKAESKMMEVKTNVEYQAAMKENTGHKEEKNKIEEEILLLLSRVEELRKDFGGREKEFKEFEKNLLAEKKQVEAEIAKLTALHQEQVNQRFQMATQLEPQIASLYQRMTQRLAGTAVAIVDNSMCLGCNMKIRPQLYNEILGSKTIHQCPSCSRILIVPNSSPNPSLEASATSK